MLLSVLSEAEIEIIHKETLRILEQVGIKVAHDEALKKLKKAGASVDQACQIVKFPAKMVEELLAQAPPIAIETGIDGKTMEVGGDNRYYSSLILDPFINDYYDGIRPPTLEDVRGHTIMGESLDRISSMMRMQLPVSDIDGPDSYLKTMEVFLCNTTKHVMIYPTSVENSQQWFDVYDVIADAAGLDVIDTPLTSVAMAVTSPLQIDGANIEILKMTVQRSYPLINTVCPMAGTTSPFSVAGTALLSNVEALAPILITQVYKPGHPCLYGFGPSVTDMKTGRDLYYNAEKMLWKTMGCQMGKFYNLPIIGECGGSLTHRPDMQNGAESMAFMLTSIVNGQNIMAGVGSMGNANGMSAEQIIMQCGLIDMSEYLMRGVDTSEHKLGFDSIKNVGPGGNYLTDELTMELLHNKEEFFESPYFDTTGGYVNGAPGMYEIAHQKAGELVESYKPTVPEKVRVAIKDFFKDKYQSTEVADM